MAGKTVCAWADKGGQIQQCSNTGHCALPPALLTLIEEYAKGVDQRDYDRLRATAESQLP